MAAVRMLMASMAFMGLRGSCRYAYMLRLHTCECLLFGIWAWQAAMLGSEAAWQKAGMLY